MGFNKGLIVGLLFVTICFVVLSGFLFSVSGNYDVTVDPEYEDTFNKYASTNALVYDIEQTVEGGEVNPNGLDASVYTNVVVAGKQSRQSADLAQDLINEVPTVIGIDPVVLGAIMSLIFAFVAFSFIAMIARRAP